MVKTWEKLALSPLLSTFLTKCNSDRSALSFQFHIGTYQVPVCNTNDAVMILWYSFREYSHTWYTCALLPIIHHLKEERITFWTKTHWRTRIPLILIVLWQLVGLEYSMVLPQSLNVSVVQLQKVQWKTFSFTALFVIGLRGWRSES